MIYLVCLIFTLAFILTVSYILTRIKSVIGQAIKKKRRTSCYHTPQKESKSVASPLFYWWPCQDEWFRTKEGVFYYSLGNYIPNRYSVDEYPFLEEHRSEITRMRQFVWDFKYNIQQPSPVAHAKAVVKAVRRISFIINRSFAGRTSSIMFLCLPASNNLIYNLRFREFAALVCKETGMADAFDYVYVIGNKTPKHLGGGQSGSFLTGYEWLAGHNVILFDDVVSSGQTIDTYSKEVASCGGKVLCALTLARTVSEEELEQELYIPYTLEDRLSELQQTTANEPVGTDDTPVVNKDVDLKV